MTSEEKRARLEALERVAREAQKRLAGLYARLGAEGPHPELEEALDQARSARDEAAKEWGLAALQWRHGGGGILYASGDGPIVHLAEPRDTPLPEDSLDGSDDILDADDWLPELPEPAFDVGKVLAIATRVGPPVGVMNDEGRVAEAAALDRELVRINTWVDLPRPVQRNLVGLFVSRLRALQDDSPPHVRSLLERQLRKGFAKLTQFSSTHQPGYVTGLGRSHRPDSGSWHGDADFWWKSLGREIGGFRLDAEQAELDPEQALGRLAAVAQATPAPLPEALHAAVGQVLDAGVSTEDGRLVQLLTPHLDALAENPHLASVVDAIRHRASGQPDTGPLPIDELQLPDDWPFAARVRGRRAALVGAELNTTRQNMFTEVFRFESLRWCDARDTPALEALANAIQDHEVDLVLVLARHINQEATDLLLPACRHARVDWVMVRRGEGLPALRGALERFLADQSATVPMAPAAAE
ncbi:MAG: hypothetical protein H6702_15015 [Myxococcales bacterium]|nr:hypothetical protein [Myxococcales bacterium]